MTTERDAVTELWVCFSAPTSEPPAGALILSFMPAAAEAAAERRWGDHVLLGRRLAQEVRVEARREYLRLVTRVGTVTCGGRTLREALRGPDGVSRWWYLKISEKNSLWGEDIYSILIQLMCVKQVAERYGVRRLRLYGAPPAFRSVLAEVLEIVSFGDTPAPRLWKSMARGLASRAAGFLFYLRVWWMVRRRRVRAHGPVDVLLEAHWDWSVQPSANGGLRDRYFSDLPHQLQRCGVSVGWLAWCEPDTAVWQRGRSLKAVVGSALAHSNVVLAERYLTLGDILRATLSFRYLLAFLRFERSPGFRELFRAKDLNLYPVLRRQLIELLVGSSVGRWELLATATRRACVAYRPKMVLTFLELFLHSRAIFAGARLASANVRLWAAQHASYCRDKTFGLIDAARELRGEPDGCPVPAPDGLFVMGDLSRDIWMGNGYALDRVVVTGGLRYQHVRIETGKQIARRPPTILLAASMIGPAELDLCQAVCAATEGLPVRIRLRDHPYHCLSERPEFAPYRDWIEVTSGTAEEDLDDADLVLFTHSGLSEEALARGLPVWQWLGAGVNTSVFLDLPGVVPTFTSVGALRRAIESFLENPEAHRPTREAQELVVRRCFGPDPRNASVAIADRIVSLIGAEREMVGA